MPSTLEKSSLLVLATSFFFSGVAALIYQLCWNRALYGAIGVDMDSVTIIVSCFMLGIGIGGALGGLIADRFPSRRIGIYAAVEMALCLCGLTSLQLMGVVADWTLMPGLVGTALTAVVAFSVLLVPTVLMGMTLPILSTAFEEKIGNLGDAVGRLYFANTFGAATGAFIVPSYLFHVVDLKQACWIAAGLNAIVACMALTALKVAETKKGVV